MIMTTIVRDKMLACTIQNGYEGLDELEQLAKVDPAETEMIAWNVLLSRGDPGKDDYALCTELFRLLEVAIGKNVVADQVSRHWPNLDEERRLNMLAAIGSGVLDTGKVEELFYSTSNSTRIRHRIAATLASCRFYEAKATIRKLVGDLGNYDSLEKQEILDSFRESVMNTE